MKRVENDELWSLMCPDQCPGLANSFGSEFEELYIKYENENKFIKKIKAQELWNVIIRSQIETGTPYMLYKDACNYKSNQKNIGVIQSSNLCTEIVEYSDSNETAVCNLASIGLPQFLLYKNIEENTKFTIYTKHNCSFCDISKMMFNKYKIEFQEIKLDDENERKLFIEELKKKESIR